MPLADFGSVTFTGMQATIGNVTGALSNWTPVALNMGTRSGAVLVQTGALNATADGFTARYVAPPVGVNPVPTPGKPGSDKDKDDLHGKSADSHGRHLGWAKILSKATSSPGRHLGWAKIFSKSH